MSLTVIGGTVVDLIFPRLPRLPVWPDHTEFTRANLVLVPEPPIVTLGGNGANAAYVAACCGADVTLYSPIGDDAPGRLARGWLEQAGCQIVARDFRATTAVNVTAASARHRRATLFHPGPSRRPFPRLPRGRVGPSHVLVCGWPHPPLRAIAAGLRPLRRRRIFTALDAGPILDRPWRLTALRPILDTLDLFLANEYELGAIAQAQSLPASLRRLREYFSGHVVIKRGRDGALWLPANRTEPLAVAGRPVRVVNTVGAGDTFNGALLAALEAGITFPAALRRAGAVAATVVGSPRGILGIERRAGSRKFGV